jgi:Carboxypeptidase regulatory-like domain
MPFSTAHSNDDKFNRTGVISALTRLFVLLLGLNSLAFASPTATITGRVTDSLGGVLVGAQVEATNVETNTTLKTKTNHLGLYRIPNLPPGYYRVIVRMFGFRTMVKPGLKLHVQDVIGLNFSMQLGSAIASITQEEGVPLVQAETGMQSTTVNQLAITNLPSLTRNPYDFVALSAGAAPTGKGGAGFALNGQRSESGSFLLDGSENNDSYNSGPGQIVPLDVVEEYRLMTHNFTAEFGRNTGFIANVVTKSGTNEFHGAAYYFSRNSALAANTYENNARGIPRPVFNRHQLGGAVGGPVLRDKLFFYAAVEPILVRSSATLSYYVPTPELLAVSSAGTNTMFRHFPLPSNLSQTDVSIRTVCPFGRFCGSTINSGFVTIPAFASITRTGPVDAGAGVPQDTLLWTGRLDYTLNERSTLNVRYAFQDVNQFATVTQPYSAELDQPFNIRNQNITLNLTRFLSGNFFTESRAVFSRLSQQSPAAPETEFPSFTITGDTISGSTGSLSLPSAKNAFGGSQSIYQFYQGANWIRGTHNLKFGWQYQHLRDGRVPTEVSFTRSNQGEFRDLQGFVDGFLTSYQLSLDPKGRVPGELIQPPFGPSSPRRNYRFNDMAGFFQDSWKISPRLTLSPGLRYEYFGAGHRTGHEKPLDASFYYGQGNSVYQQIAHGRLLRTTEAPGEYQNHYFLPRHRNLAPRLGLAYGLSGSGETVLRLGSGLFFERLPGFAFENNNPPAYSIARLTTVSLTPALFDDPYSVFPQNTIPVPPSTVTHFDQDLKTAYVAQWNAAVEHELMRNLVVSGAYLGSKGNRLYRLLNVNRIGSGQFDGRPGERLFNTASSFTTVSNEADSGFHALQLRVESPGLRSAGLQFGANYTWSHSIDNASALLGDDVSASPFPLDAFNPRLDKGSSDHDVRHRMVGHFVWQIPFGSTSGAYKKHLFSGWEISGIVSFQTGQPFNLRDSRVADADLADNTRPRVTGPLPGVLRGSKIIADARTPNAFLILPLNMVRRPDGSCLEPATPFGCQFSVNGPFNGSLGRNVFRRPGTHFQNLAFIKNFNFPASSRREGLKLQCRAEFYNFFNHSNLYFKSDTANVGVSSFNTSGGTSVPGVLASFGTPERFPQEARQLVLAVKLIF